MDTAPATHRTTLVLSLTESGARQLGRHPEFQPLRAAAPTTQHLLSRYYDTAAYDLAQAGFSLRVTRSGNMVLQTLETAQASGLAAGRDEWEWPLLNDQPDPALLTAVLTPKLLPPSGLREIFTTDLTRVERTLQLGPDTTIRASFDEGTINAGATAAPVRDLAIEVPNGEAGAIYHLAAHLHATTPLAITTDSLAARGLQLASGSLPASRKAAPIKLAAAASGAEAFHRFVVDCLNHLLVNQQAALAGGVEGVHQMRVAIRRLRALLRLYEPALDRRQLRHFDTELRRIGRVFGQARDWDVFCTELLPQANQPADPADLYDGLTSVATQRRHTAHDAFIHECQGHKFTATALELAAWAEDGRDEPDRLGRAKLARPLKDLTPRWLDRLARQVEARGQDISRANNAELHKLRKSIKKLRYGIEFTESLLPRKKSRRYQKSCKALLDTLGLINDSSTSIQLARTLRRDRKSDLRPAIFALARHQHKLQQSGLDELAKSWKAFRREARFW
jgi:triphosphatase